MANENRKLFLIWQRRLRPITFIILFCCLLTSGFGSNVNFKHLFLWLLYGEEYTVGLEEKSIIEEVVEEDSNGKDAKISNEEILTGGAIDIIYYNQNDTRWADKMYGENDNIGRFGCGPTALSIVISSFTQNEINPLQMSKWAYDNGYFSSGHGSYHALIPEGAKAYNLNVVPLFYPEGNVVIDELKKGRLVVALMAKGHFTSGGHFIVLRGVTEDGILIADPKSLENSNITWDIGVIMDEARRSSDAGGPFWSISR